MLKIVADIIPVPLARTRFNYLNKGRFLPISTLNFKSNLGLIAKAHMAGLAPFSAPLVVNIHFFKNIKVNSKNFGDIDNHVKAVLDALNGIVWIDDSLIVELHAFKHKGNPKIEIEVDFYDVH